MAKLRWIIAAVVVAFVLLAVSLMLRPEVSADYADYFIARSTDCWPRLVTGRYRLGEPLSFVNDPGGRAAVRFKQCGWLPPTDAGSYSVGSRARLRFSFPVPPEGLLLAMVAEAYVGRDHPSQRVEVRVNGERLDDLIFTPTGVRFVGLLLPPDVVALDPTGITIQFDFPDRISPATMGIGNDRRQLGLLLSQVQISPLPKQ